MLLRLYAKYICDSVMAKELFLLSLHPIFIASSTTDFELQTYRYGYDVNIENAVQCTKVSAMHEV